MSKSNSSIDKPLKQSPKIHGDTTESSKEQRTVVSAEELPRRNLEDSLQVGRIIRDTYAGKPTSWPEIAKAMGVSEKSLRNKYPLWSAVAYGIVLKNDNNRYSLGETGRKILAPTYEGEREEGIRKALFTPTVLSRFYTDYNGSPIPGEELFPNVLETRYDVPRERTKEAIQLIIENARYAKAITRREDGKEIVDFVGTEIPSGGNLDVRSIKHTELDVENAEQLLEAEVVQTAPTSEEWNKICFIITPIGSEESIERKHSDTILKHLISPVLKEFGLQAIRADKIAKPGIITKQVIEHVAYSKLCIADLSFNNPNAFYELGVRHTVKLPTIQIIRKGDKIPFDVSQGRTIIFDTSDPYTIMDRFDSARNELKEHITALMKNMQVQEDNPIQLFLPKLAVAFKK